MRWMLIERLTEEHAALGRGVAGGEVGVLGGAEGGGSAPGRH